MDGRHKPLPERQSQLDAATPELGNFVLYCAACVWIGERNAAHARSSTCPDCGNHSVRIWSHTPRRMT